MTDFDLGLERAAQRLEELAAELQAKLDDCPPGTSYGTSDQWHVEAGTYSSAAGEVRKLVGQPATIRVAVVMSNDYPADVVPADLAEARCVELRKEAQKEWEQGGDVRFGPRFKGSGNRWIKAHEFDMKVKPQQS